MIMKTRGIAELAANFFVATPR